MKYHILVIITLTFICKTIEAQNSISQGKVLPESIENALMLIEKNNPTLAAIRLETDAEKIGNRTGLNPSNPEAGFNYLWGTPDVINDRKDFSIMQSFDFPTSYVHRNNIARLKNEQAEFAYNNRKNQILSEAYETCARLIYCNAFKVILTERLNHANELAGIYNRRLETGDANIIESNKAQLNLLTVSRKYESNELARNAAIAELWALNGGNEIVLSEVSFQGIMVEGDFEKWYASAEANNPELKWLNSEISVTGKQAQLNKSLWLPHFSAGYMSEALPGETFRGVSVGMSIPLWQDRNTVNYAKARNLAAIRYETGSKLLFRTRMQSAHARVLALQKDVDNYRTSLAAVGNAALLEKALNSGQISLAEYLLELTYYYEAADQLLELEYELAKAYAELFPYRN